MDMYYIDNAGNGHTVDLSIIQDAVHCEMDVLGNMGLLMPGNNVIDVRGINADPEGDDMEALIVEVQPTAPITTDALRAFIRAAQDAGCAVAALDDDTATWWREYVEGYIATRDEIAEVMEQYRDLDRDQQHRVNTALGSIDPDKYIYDAYGDLDYEDERSQAIASIEAVRGVIDRVRGEKEEI